MKISIIIILVIKSHSFIIYNNGYKLEKVELKKRYSFSLSKKNTKKKNKIKIKLKFKSEEIGKKIILNKTERMNLNNKESFHNSINTKFRSLKEREIILKNSDLFLSDSKVRMKNEEIKNGIKLKIEGYKKIFNLIDRNNTGILSLKNLKLSLLSNTQLELVTPFLTELQKKRKSMNFKEFCILIDRGLTSRLMSEN